MAKGGFPKGMGGGGMMRQQAQMQQKIMKMQQEMARMQEELGAKTYSAGAGGGMVTAQVNGQRQLLGITIDPEAVDPDDVEMLQDMVVAAVNEAMRAAEDDAANAMKGLTGGLGLGM